MSDRISVLVADDHEIVRSGLIGIGNRPCGLRPDVVLMDLKMPHVNGWEATERIQAWQVADPLSQRAGRNPGRSTTPATVASPLQSRAASELSKKVRLTACTGSAPGGSPSAGPKP